MCFSRSTVRYGRMEKCRGFLGRRINIALMEQIKLLNVTIDVVRRPEGRITMQASSEGRVTVTAPEGVSLYELKKFVSRPRNYNWVLKQTQNERIVVEGICIEVVRKHIKRINLRVLPGGKAVVSAPVSTDPEEIRAMVSRRLGWLRAVLAQTPKAYVPEFKDGEDVPLWGERLTLRLQTPCLRSHVERRGGSLVVCSGREVTPQECQKLLHIFYESELRREIEAVWQRCVSISGVQPQAYAVQHNLRSRWGCCRISQKLIKMNTALVRYPKVCMHYVLLHEFNHLWVSGHNASFYANMDKFMPGWRKIRERLKLSPFVLSGDAQLAMLDPFV